MMIALALVLAAQDMPKPAADDNDIVVTAPAPIDGTTARHFVSDISVRADGQLAKFKDPVCPVAIGFPADIARIMVSRIRAVAREAGAAVARPDCRANIVVIRTDDGRDFVRQVRVKHAAWFNGVRSSEIDRLVAERGPVRSWTATTTANEDGQRVANGGTGDENAGVIYVKTGSAFNPQNQQIIEAATVVIDTQGAIGKTVRQLADYVAMRALAKTKPPEGPAVATILGLFGGDPADAPSGLTASDLGYLRALYAMSGNRSITYQRGRIAGQLRKGK